MNHLYSLIQEPFNVDVLWEREDVGQISSFTDCSETLKKLVSGELIVVYVKVVAECHGVKYQNGVGGIIIGSIDELKEEIEDQGLVEDIIQEFKEKLQNLVSVI